MHKEQKTQVDVDLFVHLFGIFLFCLTNSYLFYQALRPSAKILEDLSALARGINWSLHLIAFLCFVFFVLTALYTIVIILKQRDSRESLKKDITLGWGYALSSVGIAFVVSIIVAGLFSYGLQWLINVLFRGSWFKILISYAVAAVLGLVLFFARGDELRDAMMFYIKTNRKILVKDKGRRFLGFLVVVFVVVVAGKFVLPVVGGEIKFNWPVFKTALPYLLTTAGVSFLVWAGFKQEKFFSRLGRRLTIGALNIATLVCVGVAVSTLYLAFIKIKYDHHKVELIDLTGEVEKTTETFSGYFADFKKVPAKRWRSSFAFIPNDTLDVWSREKFLVQIHIPPERAYRDSLFEKISIGKYVHISRNASANRGVKSWYYYSRKKYLTLVEGLKFQGDPFDYDEAYSLVFDQPVDSVLVSSAEPLADNLMALGVRRAMVYPEWVPAGFFKRILLPADFLAARSGAILISVFFLLLAHKVKRKRGQLKEARVVNGIVTEGEEMTQRKEGVALEGTQPLSLNHIMNNLERYAQSDNVGALQFAWNQFCLRYKDGQKTKSLQKMTENLVQMERLLDAGLAVDKKHIEVQGFAMNIKNELEIARLGAEKRRKELEAEIALTTAKTKKEIHDITMQTMKELEELKGETAESKSEAEKGAEERREKVDKAAHARAADFFAKKHGARQPVYEQFGKHLEDLEVRKERGELSEEEFEKELQNLRKVRDDALAELERK